jgi:hypothetical protein
MASPTRSVDEKGYTVSIAKLKRAQCGRKPELNDTISLRFSVSLRRREGLARRDWSRTTKATRRRH